jgi:RNA polymerase sigma-70 factor (ECF subfamily)
VRVPTVATASQGADEDLLRALWAEHGQPLMRFALRLTNGDRGRAEDVVQETLLRAWRHPDAVDPARGPARAWLLTVAHRLAVDAHRRRRARPPEVAIDRLDQVAAADQMEQVLESWLIEDALHSLSTEHRAVLQETYFNDRSVAEAAAVLGIPAGTVKSRTYYALRALRLTLQERGVLP